MIFTSRSAITMLLLKKRVVKWIVHIMIFASRSVIPMVLVTTRVVKWIARSPSFTIRSAIRMFLRQVLKNIRFQGLERLLL